MRQIFGIIIIAISLLICLLAPTSYNREYIQLCAVLYGIFVLIYLMIKRKNNYLDFDSLFFVSYFFVTLYYPTFMYETDPFRYVFYELGFDKNTMTISSGLAILGISSYMMGSLMISNKLESKKIIDTKSKKTEIIKTTWIYVTAILLVLLFIFTGGYAKLINEYVGGGAEDISEGGISSYFYVFFPAFLFAGIIAEFHNLRIIDSKKVRFSSINKLGIVATAAVFLMFFMVGSRTIPIQIVLLILGLYTLLYRPFGLMKFSMVLVIGFVILALVGFLRSVLNRGLEFHVEDSAMDLIINNRNTFLAVERVNRHGINYGESMLSPILAPLPFAQSFAIFLFGINEDDMRSALVFTKDTFGYVGDWGLGTNILADVYISFGILGIVIFFIALGYFVNLSMKRSFSSISYMVLYGVLISYAVYIVRAEYFFFFRYFVWSYLIILFALKYQKIGKF
jgi:oligosaccharide repeat unit polymerase